MASDRLFRRNMALLWAGQLVSSSGDALFLLCVAWVAGRAGGDAPSVGGAVFLAALPFLLFGPFAGALADRWDRRRLMIASDLARAALLLALPALADLLGGLSVALVGGTAFVVATLSTPFLPARDALLPDLAAGRPLARWNAAIQTSWQLAQILGLLLGGLLLAGAAASARDEVRGVLRILQYDGLTFLVSALALAWIVVPAPAPGHAPRASVRADVLEGARYALRDPVVRSLLLLTALDNLALMGPAMVGPTLLLQQDLGLSAGHLAFFEGGMAAGMLLGALFIARAAPRLSPGRLVLWGMLLDGLSYLPFLWIRDYPWMLVAIAVHGLFIPFIVVGRTSLLQAWVPAGQRGRVFAFVGLTVSGMTALSAGLSGLLAAWTGARGLFGIAGGFGALCGLVGLLLLRGRFAAASASGRMSA